jgi:hypothetical protein
LAQSNELNDVIGRAGLEEKLVLDAASKEEEGRRNSAAGLAECKSCHSFRPKNFLTSTALPVLARRGGIQAQPPTRVARSNSSLIRPIISAENDVPPSTAVPGQKQIVVEKGTILLIDPPAVREYSLNYLKFRNAHRNHYRLQSCVQQLF